MRTKQLITVICVCALAVMIYLISNYFSQKSQNEEVIKEINDKTQAIALIVKPVNNLEALLVETEKENRSIKELLNNYSHKSQSDIINLLLDKAADLDVKINPISSDEWKTQLVEGSTYKVLPLDLNLKGELGDIIAFVDFLSNIQEFPFLSIDSVHIFDNDFPDQTESNSDLPQEFSVEMNLSVYMKMDSIE